MLGWLLASMSGLTRTGHARDAPLRRGDRRYPIEFAGRFGIDRPDAGGNRVFELVACLADARKDNVARREAGTLRHADFAAGIRIGSTPQPAQQARDRQRRIRLERIVDRVRIRCERLVDAAIGLANRPRAVNVGRRAGLLDDRLKADAVTGKSATCRLKRLVHEQIACYHARIPAIDTTHVTDVC